MTLYLAKFWQRRSGVRVVDEQDMQVGRKESALCTSAKKHIKHIHPDTAQVHAYEICDMKFLDRS